jgi:hypothetical protein
MPRVDRRTARLDPKARSLLAELERALLEALTDSAEVQALLGRLGRAGLSVRLSLECFGSEAGEPVGPSEPREPAFRIDAQDLAFLRSIGIDPTRRARRPRRS